MAEDSGDQKSLANGVSAFSTSPPSHSSSAQSFSSRGVGPHQAPPCSRREARRGLMLPNTSLTTSSRFAWAVLRPIRATCNLSHGMKRRAKTASKSKPCDAFALVRNVSRANLVPCPELSRCVISAYDLMNSWTAGVLQRFGVLNGSCAIGISPY